MFSFASFFDWTSFPFGVAFVVGHVFGDGFAFAADGFAEEFEE